MDGCMDGWMYLHVHVYNMHIHTNRNMALWT